MIPLKRLKSSAIRSVGYDEVTKTLAVHFAGGGLYHYAGVEPEVYQDLLKAQSHGAFLATRVKGKYPHTKVGARRKHAAV